LKVFLTASLEERARRRYLELKAKGYDVSFEDVLKQTQERDRLDSTRDDSPLMPAEDAIIIDTTHMSPEEVVQQILSALRQRTEGDESNTACGFKQ
jgi:cytidylate kinase